MRKIFSSLIIISALGGLITIPGQVSACSCMMRDPGVKAVQADFDRVGAIFEGKVQSVSLKSGEIEFAVSKTWKGPNGKEFTIKGAGDSASCGWVPEEGKTYVIYAGLYEGEYTTSLCEPNHEAPLTSDEQKVFGQGTTTVDAIKVGMWKSFFGSIQNFFSSFFSGLFGHKTATNEPNVPVAYECDADGKICPDGSVVGRTGSKCEFAACPLPNATSTIIRTTLGQPMTGLNVTLTPKEIISDSRCPKDVQCIWAGTVEVKTTMATQVSHGEHVVKLNEPRVFGNYTVTLIEVTPAPTAGEPIPGSSYRFVYEVKKR